MLRQEINAAFQGELRRFSLDILVGERLGTIIEHVRDKGADLIVLGDTTKRRWKDLFIGTTTERSCATARQPVLVVSVPATSPTSARWRHGTSRQAPAWRSGWRFRSASQAHAKSFTPGKYPY